MGRSTPRRRAVSPTDGAISPTGPPSARVYGLRSVLWESMSHDRLDPAPACPGAGEAARVIALVGPTATGKSALAIELAAEFGGEIVNADSMQLYRGMDIGTAKTPPSQRRGVPHHLLDVLDVTEDASVAAYRQDARATIASIQQRSTPALLVGGSGLYVRATLDELEFPETDPEVRARWELRGQEQGPGILHAELAIRDPEAAERIGRHNTRRLVRALEVIEITGRPFSASLPRYAYAVPAIQLALDVPRDLLVDRITARGRAMLADGLLAETEALREVGLERGVTASRAVGYAQALAVLDGRMSKDEAAQAIAIATRQLARRQRSWFGRDPRIVWLDGTASLRDQVQAAHQALAGNLQR